MKRLFYCDSQVEDYEQKLELSKVIVYLEDKYNQTEKKEILLSIISYSWFYMVEGDVNQEPKNYDWEFFKVKLIKYLDIAFKLYFNDERFCYVIGYILSLNWEYLGQDYELLGNKCILKCLQISEEESIKYLIYRFMGKTFNVSSRFIQTLCDELFPSKSLVDTYFKGVVKI